MYYYLAHKEMKSKAGKTYYRVLFGAQPDGDSTDWRTMFFSPSNKSLLEGLKRGTPVEVEMDAEKDGVIKSLRATGEAVPDGDGGEGQGVVAITAPFQTICLVGAALTGLLMHAGRSLEDATKEAEKILADWLPDVDVSDRHNPFA